MVDIHTHIMPALDDGAESMDVSLAMAKTAYEDGVTDIIVTPHCNIPKLFNNYDSPFLQDYFENFKRRIHQAGIPLNLYRGMEVYATKKIFDLYNTERIITLNNSRYLLVEFDFDENPDWVIYCLEGLLDYGVVPIVAHPERYHFVYDFPNIVYHWTELGCLSQVNRGSILGEFGKNAMKTAVAVIDNGLAQFIGSDAHSNDRRNPKLSVAYAVISKNWSKDKADELFCTNPHAVIENREILAKDPRPIV